LLRCCSTGEHIKNVFDPNAHTSHTWFSTALKRVYGYTLNCAHEFNLAENEEGTSA
jgi:hypothetical protein